MLVNRHAAWLRVEWQEDGQIPDHILVLNWTWAGRSQGAFLPQQSHIWTWSSAAFSDSQHCQRHHYGDTDLSEEAVSASLACQELQRGAFF